MDTRMAEVYNAALVSAYLILNPFKHTRQSLLWLNLISDTVPPKQRNFQGVPVSSINVLDLKYTRTMMLYTMNHWRDVAMAISKVRNHNPNNAKVEHYIAVGFKKFCDALWLRALDSVEDRLGLPKSIAPTEAKEYAIAQLNLAEDGLRDFYLRHNLEHGNSTDSPVW